jgi:uncharacterized repeat protein (TIGR01451 family)
VQGLSRHVALGLSAAALCAAGAVPALAQDEPEAEQPEAKVRISVKGGRGAEPGATVRYRFTVRNVGRVALDSVRATTRLPRSLEYLRGGEFRSARRTVLFPLGRIAPGRVRSRLLVVRVADDADPDGRIELRAKVVARPASGDE